MMHCRPKNRVGAEIEFFLIFIRGFLLFQFGTQRDASKADRESGKRKFKARNLQNHSDSLFSIITSEVWRTIVCISQILASASKLAVGECDRRR